MTLLASGTTGSIGKHLVDAYAVKSRLEDSTENILNEFTELSPSVFIHLAGVTSIKLIKEYNDLSLRLNVNGALRMMEAFAKSGGKRFIFASTGHVYGATDSNRFAREIDATEPISIYAKHKLLAETKLTEKAKELGINLVIARIFSVFGRDMAEHYLATKILKDIGLQPNTEEYPVIENGSDVRDFLEPIQVANRLSLIAKTMKISNQIQILNICSGVPITVSQKVLSAHPKWPEDKIKKTFSPLPHLVGSTELSHQILGI